MKEYKFISNPFTKEISKKVNEYVKKGWILKEWKVNDNTIVVLLERGQNNENKD